MLAYSVRRLLATVPLLVIATFAVYWLTSMVNNPLAALALCQECDQSAYDRIIDVYDLDQPVPVRYVNWVGDALTGDFGESVATGQEVRPLLLERAANSARLAIPAFVIVVVLAIVLGVFSAVRQYTRFDHVVTTASFVGISVPTFVVGLLLQIVFVVWWPEWFNVRPFVTQGMRTGSVGEIVASHTLPVLTLVLVVTASESRFQRAAMLEVLRADYLRFARAKGLPPRTVLFKHGLRNAVIPLVTVSALDFAALLGGSVVTETIFSWPGLGPLFLDAITSQDLNLTMGIVMFLAVLVIVINLVADLLYGVLDPRIRYD